MRLPCNPLREREPVEVQIGQTEDLALDEALRDVTAKHRIVLDGGVEPQTVALIAVIERRLERSRGTATSATCPAATSSATASAASGLLAPVALVVVLVLVLVLVLVVILGLLRGGGIKLGGDQRVIFVAGFELLVALEGLDLLHCHFELMGDPRVGPPLADPCANTVELGS